MLADLAVLAAMLALCILVAMLLSWAAPHWVEQLPTVTTTTVATGAVWPSPPRNRLERYGDTRADQGEPRGPPMRFRLRVSGDGLELRGYIDDDPDGEAVADRIATLAHGMRRARANLDVAPADDNYNPFD